MDYKGWRARTRSTTFKQDIKPGRTKDNIFLKPKDDRNVYGERVDDRLEAGYRELKRFGKTQSRWWNNDLQRGDITKESEEMQIEALKRGLREAKGNVWRRRYHFRDPHVDEQRPICVILCR